MRNLKGRDLNWEVGMRNAEFKGQRFELGSVTRRRPIEQDYAAYSLSLASVFI